MTTTPHLSGMQYPNHAKAFTPASFYFYYCYRVLPLTLRALIYSHAVYPVSLSSTHHQKNIIKKTIVGGTEPSRGISPDKTAAKQKHKARKQKRKSGAAAVTKSTLPLCAGQASPEGMRLWYRYHSGTWPGSLVQVPRPRGLFTPLPPSLNYPITATGTGSLDPSGSGATSNFVS